MSVTLAIQRNPTAINAIDYAGGLIPNGIADFTAIIQAALNAANTARGGNVVIPFAGNGNYVISAPLVIYSNTKLTLAQGVTITLAANSNCNMIKNAAVTPQRVVTDAAITSNQTSLTSNTANFTSADIGRTVGVIAAGPQSKLLMANIVSVQSATSCTLNTSAGSTVSGATCSIYNRDSYIEVTGGYWNRGNNGYVNNQNFPGYFTTQFKHVDNIYIHDLTAACTQRGYHVALGDTTNYYVQNITSVSPNNVSNTDVVNVHGPAQWGRIDNIHGTNGDDFVSLHSIDADPNLQDTAGNIIDIVVTNIFPNNCPTAFKAHGGNSFFIRSLTVRGIHGTSSGGGIAIRDYGTPTSDNEISDLIIEDVDIITNSTMLTLYCNNAVGTVTIKNLVWRQANNGSDIIDILSGNSLRNLIVDGLQIEAGTSCYGIMVEGSISNIDLSNVTCPDTSVQINALVQVQSGVTGINKISVRNVHWFASSGAQNPIILNKGSVKTVVLDNIYLNNGGIAFIGKNAGASCQCLMSNIILDGAYQLAQQIGCAVDYIINNLNVINTSQSSLIALTSAGANMSVRGRGLINPNAYTTFTRDGSQIVRIVHPEMLADLSTLQNNAGDECTNTNGSLSSGTGRCIANGTNWKNIYSGSTY